MIVQTFVHPEGLFDGNLIELHRFSLSQYFTFSTFLFSAIWYSHVLRVTLINSI